MEVKFIKKFEAIIRRSKLDEVKNLLEEFEINDIMVSNVACWGKERRIEIYRGRKYAVTLIGKVKIEAVIPDRFAVSIVKAIATIAETGELGDGQIITIIILLFFHHTNFRKILHLPTHSQLLLRCSFLLQILY